MNPQKNTLLLVSIVALALLGCSQTTPTAKSGASLNYELSAQKSTSDKNRGLRWLYYADPRAEANLAIQKNNFQLMAVAGKNISFPGVLSSEVESLKTRCGYRLFDYTGEQHSKLSEYAATYNQMVWKACNKQDK